MSGRSLDWIATELERIRAQGLHRSLLEVESAPAAELVANGRRYANFASNDYLGLAADPRVRAAAIDAVERFGTSASASRLISGNNSLHRELESRLAELKDTEDCLVFASGYMANVGTISALLGPDDVVFSDALNHASIIDGCRLSGATIHVYPHRDVAALSQLLSQSEARRRLIVTDGVFGMDGDLAPLPELVSLAEQFGCMLMVDEAHATGILGSEGGGSVEHFGLSGRVSIVMGTLSKALAAAGGYVAGDRRLIDFLRNRARAFIFTTGLPPAAAGAALAALEIVRTEPERRLRLRFLAQQLHDGLRAIESDVQPVDAAIVPVLVGDSAKALAIASCLRERGVFAPAIRPPTVPAGSSRIRFSLMATHSDDQVRRALEAFSAARESLPC